IVEGGISRRRSSSLWVIEDTNYAKVTASSEPFGLYTNFQIVRRGSNYYFPAQPVSAGYNFLGWFVDSNRVDDPQGFSVGILRVEISMDTTLVARFIPTGTDSDEDGLDDAFEWYYFSSLTNTPASNPSGD